MPGELGEILVIHANTGEWNVWTADGLLAAQILLHKMNPRARLFGPAESKPGMRLDPLTASQEHFHGFFTRTEGDNRCYIVAGFTHMSILEVLGLDRFRRFACDVEVTPADLEKARAWDAQRVRRESAARALVLTVRRAATPPSIDGDAAPHEWPAPEPLDESGDVRFAASYDDDRLYLCWNAKGVGPLRNGGEEFQRFFKTGAALDLRLGTSPSADPARTKPVAGDLRLLVTQAGGRPRVVLYQPVCPGAAPGERWATRTAAAGETAFDRVVELRDAQVAVRGEGDFVAEIAVPLRTLGLTVPDDGQPLRLDWGVLVSPDGNQVSRRLYWSDKSATGTSDEAVEARLDPSLWGYVRFETALRD